MVIDQALELMLEFQGEGVIPLGDKRGNLGKNGIERCEKTGEGLRGLKNGLGPNEMLHVRYSF
jgi:hypothetical protein